MHDSLVDNAGVGVLLCAFGAGKWLVVDASDEHGTQYNVDPGSGKTVMGYKVPDWDKAKLFKQLVEVVPDNRYTGGDLDYTDKGWYW